MIQIDKRKEIFMSKPIHLDTLGHISCRAGVSVPEVLRIVEDVGASPLFVIDNVPHFSNEVSDTVMAIARNLVGTVAFDQRYGSKAGDDQMPGLADLVAFHQQFLAEKANRADE